MLNFNRAQEAIESLAQNFGPEGKAALQEARKTLERLQAEVEPLDIARIQDALCLLLSRWERVGLKSKEVMEKLLEDGIVFELGEGKYPVLVRKARKGE